MRWWVNESAKAAWPSASRRLRSTATLANQSARRWTTLSLPRVHFPAKGHTSA